MIKKESPRRLGDLFQVGKEFTIEDSVGSVTVWLQKMSPVEQEKAVRHAQASKARFLSRRNSGDDDSLSVTAEVYDMTEETLIDYLVADQYGKKLASTEARVAEENEWTKEEYLTGLLDVWNGTGEDGDPEPLKDVYAKKDDPDVDLISLEEAKRVYAELERYNKQIEDEFEAYRLEVRSQFENLSIDRLRELAAERLLEMHSDLLWSLEYRKYQVLYTVRELDDHSQYYFASRDELDALPLEVMNPLLEAVVMLPVGVEEGKGLPETEPSPPSPEQQETQEALVS